MEVSIIIIVVVGMAGSFGLGLFYGIVLGMNWRV